MSEQVQDVYYVCLCVCVSEWGNYRAHQIGATQSRSGCEWVYICV